MAQRGKQLGLKHKPLLRHIVAYLTQLDSNTCALHCGQLHDPECAFAKLALDMQVGVDKLHTGCWLGKSGHCTDVC
jgi:hypothetical protein